MSTRMRCFAQLPGITRWLAQPSNPFLRIKPPHIPPLPLGSRGFSLVGRYWKRPHSPHVTVDLSPTISKVYVLRMISLPRGREGSSHTAMAFELKQQPSTPISRPRPCRIIVGVDVSGSMKRLINAVILGMKEINLVLENRDLVSVMYVFKIPF